MTKPYHQRGANALPDLRMDIAAYSQVAKAEAKQDMQRFNNRMKQWLDPLHKTVSELIKEGYSHKEAWRMAYAINHN